MNKICSRLRELRLESKDELWEPKSLDHLLREVNKISTIANSDDSLILFRGQTNIDWPIDSTFVRNSIQKLFGIRNYSDLPGHIRKRSTFHRAIASLLLMKFDQIIKPSEEAYEKEHTHHIDPYFELFKHVQQYPEQYEEVPFIKGTNLIDWTHVADIALYFSAISGIRSNRAVSSGDGVLYIFNASATGNIHQTIKTKQLFDNMTAYDFLNGEACLPLMLHPQKQTNQERATNQKPVYIAQMNFSFSMVDVWKQYEKEMDKKVFLKVRITENLKRDINRHLESNGITEGHVYPH